MRMPCCVCGLVSLVFMSEAWAGIAPPPPKPASIAMVADVTVTGKVTEQEKDEVEAKPHFGAADDAKVKYTIRVIKIDEALVGAKGLTQVRVGITDTPMGSRRSGPPLGGGRPKPVKLDMGQEGCFFLTRHPSADFYVLHPQYGVPVLKADPDYDKVMAEVRLVAKTIADPASVLKSKVQGERFLAANTMLARAPRLTEKGSEDPQLEDMTAEENKLVLDILLEMPWTFTFRAAPPPGRLLTPYVVRTNLFSFVDPYRYGYRFQAPPAPRGVSPPDMTKEHDRSSAAFLRDNADRIKLQKLVRPK